MAAKVAVLMGSQRDSDKMKGAVDVLTAFGVPHESMVMSAHRNPEKVAEFCRLAARKGFEVIVAAAGMANHLAGAAAAHSRLPVYGVPLSGGVAGGLDALLSTAQMPPGVTVGSVAVDGSANAALLAIRQLATHDPVLDRKLRGFIERGANVRAPMPVHSGKVRDTFELPDMPHLLLWTSNRLSAFDWVLEDPIPGKGAVLTELTRWWLGESQLGCLMPNHLVDHVYPRLLPDWAQPLAAQVMLVRKLEMVPLECIVRGYLEGSAWREYEKSGTMHGQKLPVGMQRCEQLPEPAFTPSTKAAVGQHDENIDFDGAVAIVGAKTAEEVRTASLELYREAQRLAEARGILVLDTKFEFGRDPETGELVLADEVFTPDSSRFVDADTYQPGRAPLSMDKEYVRQWLKQSGWDSNGTEPPPPLPQYVIWETARRYQEICERLTGRPLAD